MKIAMIGHKRIPSREGGIEIVVEELAERMVAKGHEVYCSNRKGHHVSGDKDNDLDIDFKVIGEVNSSDKIQITLSNGEVREIENRGYNHYVS